MRAVDRIDDPAPFERTGERVSRLLAEERVLRKRGADLAAQPRLDVAVRATDEVLRPFELDGQPLAIAEVLVGERTGATGDGLGECVAFI